MELKCHACGAPLVGKNKRVEQFGKKIWLYRIKHGYTQETLAYRIGVTRTNIHRWENGKTKPNKLAQRILKQERII